MLSPVASKGKSYEPCKIVKARDTMLQLAVVSAQGSYDHLYAAHSGTCLLVGSDLIAHAGLVWFAAGEITQGWSGIHVTRREFGWQWSSTCWLY